MLGEPNCQSELGGGERRLAVWLGTSRGLR